MRAAMKLDDFVCATNLARYQRMLDESMDKAERETIRKLLAEELAKQEPTRPRAKRDSTRLRAEPEV
jgi:hypothetical protein